MKVTKEDVQHVADLANLDLTAEEQARMVRDLNSILDNIDRLNQLDTSGVEPMAYASNRFGIDPGNSSVAGFAYSVRDDHTRPGLPRAMAMQNAPDSNGTFFKVPKVIER